MSEPSIKIVRILPGQELAGAEEAAELGLEEAPEDTGTSIDEMEEHHGVVSKQPV